MVSRTAACERPRRISAPRSGRMAPPDPRIRATSVAKYQPPASTSATGPSAIVSPAPKEHDALGERGRELHVVGRDDDGRSPRRQVPRPPRERVLARAVETAGRLVQADEPRAIAVGPSAGHHDGEREPLALAARKVPGIRAGRPFQAHRFERPSARLPRKLFPTRSRTSRSPGAWGSSAQPAGARTFPREVRSRPAADLSSVVFPAPFRPMSATRSPRDTRRSRPRRASRPPVPSSSSTHAPFATSAAPSPLPAGGLVSVPPAARSGRGRDGAACAGPPSRPPAAAARPRARTASLLASPAPDRYRAPSARTHAGSHRRRSVHRPARSRGRRPPDTLEAMLREHDGASPIPRSAAGAGRSARRRRPDRAGTSARPATRGGGVRRAPRRARPAAARLPTGCRPSGPAGVASRAPAPPPRPPGPGPRPTPRASPAATRAPPSRWSTRPASPGPAPPARRRAPRSAGPCSRTSIPTTSSEPATSPPW